MNFLDVKLKAYSLINYKSANIGSVTLSSKNSILYSSIANRAEIALFLGFIIFVISMLLASHFKKLITIPIIELVDSIKKIITENSYDSFVKKKSEGEVGILAENFNILISKVRNRDISLQQSNDEMKSMIDELKAAQDKLVQHEKLSSIGLLSAGIAHEIKNPLSFVHSNLGLFKDYTLKFLSLVDAQDKYINKTTEADDVNTIEQLHTLREEIDIEYITKDVHRLLLSSEEGVSRIINIVQGLQDFSRSEEGEEKTNININDCLESAINLVWNKIKYKCTLEKKFDSIPDVMGYPGKLSQVFVNVLINACQAIDEIGKIHVSTSTDNEFITIMITDTGCGIDENDKGKIFDPFYTSKPLGEGTGLGLSISFGIIEQHGGDIKVKSTVGHGTSFTILLPIST